MFGLDGRAGTGPGRGSKCSDEPAVGDLPVSGRLTTAETLVLGVVAAHLSIRELLTWTFDDEANFRVVATDRLMLVAQTVGVTAAVGSASPTSIVERPGRTTATQGARA